MKKIIIYALTLGLISPAVTSCLDEAVPTSIAVQEQIDQVGSVDQLVNGITKYMNTVGNTSAYNDIGYPSMLIHRDIMTADMPVRDPGYYYFSQYAYCLYLGNYQLQSDIWKFYNGLVQKSNLVIAKADKTNASDAPALATAYAYRAMALMDMARMYEFRLSGTSVDSYYDEVKGLTVPLITENTTEAHSFNNPRAPFYKMYRMIMTDLRNAEAALKRVGSDDEVAKNKASKAVIYGLQARLWLEIATRFDRSPEDLAEQLAHEDETYDSPADLGPGYALLPLGVNSAVEAYTNAADAARAAINCGFSPLAKSEWFNPATGFNSANNSSWIWAIMMSSSDEMASYYTWQSWVSYMSPEASYGVSGPSYMASHMIDRQLYESITPGDWRRFTWIGPKDLGDEEVFNRDYADKTNFDFTNWSRNAAYVGIKYHPGQGNCTASQTGNCVDIPLMRVEEMYFIEAEAKAKSVSPAAGKQLLEDFMNNYRMEGAKYTCSYSDVDAIIEEIVHQKRIEFWGEGISYFDISRLRLPVIRGYNSTNHPSSYRYNSYGDGLAPAWFTIYIPQREHNLNNACVMNPDPSSAAQECKWKNN